MTFELIANESESECESEAESVVDFNDFMKPYRRVRDTLAEYLASPKREEKKIEKRWQIAIIHANLNLCAVRVRKCVFMRAFCRHLRAEFINTPIEVEI